MKAFLPMSKSIFSNIFLMLILKKILCLRGNVLYNVIVKKKKDQLQEQSNMAVTISRLKILRMIKSKRLCMVIVKNIVNLANFTTIWGSFTPRYTSEIIIVSVFLTESLLPTCSV